MDEISQKKAMKSLVEISQLVTNSTDFFEIKDIIIDKMLEIVHPTKACVNLFYKNNYDYAYLVCSQTLTHISKVFPIEEPKGVKINFDKYPDYVHEAVKHQKNIYIKDVFKDERSEKERELATQEGYKGRVVFPLIVSDKVVGFMTCFLKESDYIDSEDMDYISSIASLISLSIEITMKSKDTQLLVKKLRGAINYINRATMELYSKNDIRKFLDTISKQACNITNSKESFIVVKDREANKQIFSFYNPTNERSNLKIIMDRIVEGNEHGTYNNHCEESTNGDIHSYIYHDLFDKNKVIGYIACVNSNNYTKDDLNILAILSKQVAMAMKTYYYNSKELKHKILENELDILSNQQKLIMNKAKIKCINKKDISFYHKPARVVGGDFYHSVKIKDKVYTIIADVMGHGMMSNYFVAMIKGAFKTLAHHGRDADYIMSHLNNVLYDEFDELETFTTAIVTTTNSKDGRMRIANAGHYKPIGIKFGSDEVIVDELECIKGVPLGVIDNFPYSQLEYDTYDYKMICMYTDGIIEVKNSEKEEYGIERLKKFLVENCHLSKDEIETNLIKELKLFSNKDTYEDDILLVMFKDKNGDEDCE